MTHQPGCNIQTGPIHFLSKARSPWHPKGGSQTFRRLEMVGVTAKTFGQIIGVKTKGDGFSVVRNRGCV